MRNTSPESPYADRICLKLQELLKYALAHIIDPLTTENFKNIDTISDNVWLQATLPPKMGGFGIQDPVLHLLPAFIAASITGSTSFLHLMYSLQHTYCNGDSHISTAINATTTTSNNLYRPSLDNIIEEISANGTINLLQHYGVKYMPESNMSNNSNELRDLISSSSRLQSILSRNIHTTVNESYRSKLSPIDLIRLDSCCHEGSILITTLPCSAEFHIAGDHIFRERLRMRLGLPIPGIPMNMKCVCNGKSINDPLGYHLLSVCNVGNQRIATHNAVRDAVVDMCKSALVTTSIEDTLPFKRISLDSKRRVDIWCDNFLPGISLALDVSIVDPRQFEHFPHPKPGIAAQHRESAKIKENESILAKASSQFSPFVIESFGRWGPKTRAVFKQLLNKVNMVSSPHSDSLNLSTVAHYWRSRITMAMHRQACTGFYNRLTTLLNHERLHYNNKNNVSCSPIPIFPIPDDNSSSPAFEDNDDAINNTINSSILPNKLESP